VVTFDPRHRRLVAGNRKYPNSTEICFWLIFYYFSGIGDRPTYFQNLCTVCQMGQNMPLSHDVIVDAYARWSRVIVWIANKSSLIYCALNPCFAFRFTRFKFRIFALVQTDLRLINWKRRAHAGWKPCWSLN